MKKDNFWDCFIYVKNMKRINGKSSAPQKIENYRYTSFGDKTIWLFIEKVILKKIFCWKSWVFNEQVDFLKEKVIFFKKRFTF